MARKIIGVLAAYVIFAASAGLWFQFTRHAPHQAAALRFELATLAYGIFFALVAGFITQLICRESSLKTVFFLAGLICLVAVISMLSSAGSHWTQLQTVFAFTPASVAGGYLYKRSGRR